jgi:phosphatidate cytidylyltransferase
MFCGFFYLSIVRGWTTLVFIVLICILSDSFAYLSGTFFGQHKMAPKLSPKKT